MNDDSSANRFLEKAEPERDPALKSVLREWQTPDVPPALDARVLESYRRLRRPEPWWRRFFTSSIRVPLPVAAGTLALLFITAVIALRPIGTSGRPVPSGAANGSLQAARVEPPVVIHTSLAGFEPVSEVNVSVVTEHRQ